MTGHSFVTRNFALKCFLALPKPSPSATAAICEVLIPQLNAFLGNPDVTFALVSALSALEIAPLSFDAIDLRGLFAADYGARNFAIKGKFLRILLARLGVGMVDSRAEFGAFLFDALWENRDRLYCDPPLFLECLSHVVCQFGLSFKDRHFAACSRYLDSSPGTLSSLLRLALSAEHPVDVVRAGWLLYLQPDMFPPPDRAGPAALLARIGPAVLPVPKPQKPLFHDCGDFDAWLGNRDNWGLPLSETCLAHMSGVVPLVRLGSEAENARFLQKVVDFCLYRLKATTWPAVSDPLAGLPLHSLGSRALLFSIDSSPEKTVEAGLDFGALFVWYALQSREIAMEKIVEDIRNSPFKDILEEDAIPKLPFSLISGILVSGTWMRTRGPSVLGCRRFWMRKRKRNRAVRPQDSLLTTLIRLEGNAEDLKTARIHLVQDTSEGERDSRWHPRSTDRPSVMSILKAARARNPNLRFIDDDFVAKFTAYIKSPAIALGVYQPISDLVLDCPYLFPLHWRVAMAKIIAFAPCVSIPVLLELTTGQYFEPRPPVEVTCVVTRENLASCGQLIMDAFGPGIPWILVRFAGESTSGIGQTREFFRMLARGLFDGFLQIASGVDHSDPTHIFDTFGYLMGKSVYMNIPLGVAVPPDFLDSVFRVHSCPQYAARGEPLRDESPLRRHVAWMEFTSALWRVVPTEFAACLSGKEFSRLIEGDAPKFSREDIEQYFEVSPEDRASRQWEMLRDVLSELTERECALFLAFVSGADRFPLGGIAHFRPPISVSWPFLSRDGPDWLPTAVTCENELILPSYPNKEHLRSKLLYALENANQGFC
jgi:hypothetical protein